jgi:hypothetical protein
MEVQAMPKRPENEEIEVSERSGDLRAWLHAESLEALADVNDACLELFAEQSMARTTQAHPMLRELAEQWRTLDAGARRRAAACPFLLVDAGFADAARWRSPGTFDVSEPDHPAYRAFFTVPRSADVARLVFTFAWHLSQTQQFAARMMLGMPADCASLIAGRTLREIQEVGKRYPGWLRPRWPGRVKVWREFLVTAVEGESTALEQSRMHGLQLLAAESRSSSAR